MIVSGFHLDPAKFVLRIHRRGMRAQVIEFTERAQMEALISAATELLADGRTPREVADAHGVSEGDFTRRRSPGD